MKHLSHPLDIGAKCEAADANGDWWGIVILEVKEEGIYKARVSDGADTIWEAVSKENTRLCDSDIAKVKGLEEDLAEAELQKNEDKCDAIESEIETILRGGIRKYKLRDAVDVRHSSKDKWQTGTVTSLRPSLLVDTGSTVNNFKHIRFSEISLSHPVAVGTICEGLDAEGTWWPMTIKRVLSDNASYTAVVDDGANTEWPCVLAANTRKTQEKKIEKQTAKVKSAEGANGKTKEKEGKASSTEDTTTSGSTPRKKKSSRKKDKKKSKKEKKSKKDKKKNSPDKEKTHHHHHHHDKTQSTTNIKKGDIITTQGSRAVVTSIANGKTLCKLVSKQELAVEQAERIDREWVEMRSVGVCKSAECIHAERESPKEITISRETNTGGSDASAVVLSPAIPPDSPPMMWRFKLNHACKAKKCSAPSSVQTPGPLSIGIQQEGVSTGHSLYFHTSKMPPSEDGVLMYTMANGSTQNMFPALLPNETLTLVVDRAEGRLTWSCGGEIFEQFNVPRYAAFRVFVAMSRGHSVTVVSPSSDFGIQVSPAILPVVKHLSAVLPFTQNPQLAMFRALSPFELMLRYYSGIDDLLVTFSACVLYVLRENPHLLYEKDHRQNQCCVVA
eukprot:TRINITY_DN307_c2_g1_i1.p1 TRINITY_DN307_c2_g1~~TRINITY_DN307_c2_g1_i1.p1  ORF type:complete len:615 (+),score=80.58 TRINITY_DN307_c2_g1_i1:57-1901(+)